MKNWREDPFRLGRRYLVTKSFETLRDQFQKGEKLTYSEQTYSRYDCQTGFVFTDAVGSTRVIDIHDDEPLESITEKMELID